MTWPVSTAAVGKLGVLAFATVLGVANASVIEETADVPVQVTDPAGNRIAQSIKVTLLWDDDVSGKRPAIVINHGRPSNSRARAAFGRSPFADVSKWFVAQGFVVALPTRIGYGVSGGTDVEASGGACDARRFGPGFAAAADETLAVIGWLAQRAEVDAERTVAIGQSYGGAATVAVAARNPKGLVAAINFAGGSGGDPNGRAGRPCSPHAIESIFAEYGRSARVPMLWVYAENDRYWGSTIPNGWAEAFRKAGGNVRFVAVPPAGEDGHTLFAEFPDRWKPMVIDFLRSQGFALSGAGRARP
jgi:dienelactone hydrolase